MQPELRREIEYLYVGMVNEDKVIMEIELTLEEKIWEGQVEDAKLKGIRQLIRDNKTSDFSEDSQDTLWLGKWICVPNLKHIKGSILREAYDSAYNLLHPSRPYQDVQGFEDPILVVRYEARCHGIRSLMWHLSESKSGTPKTSWITTTSEDSRMEVGRNQNGFHSWITSYPS
jgi:hypothetical protein